LRRLGRWLGYAFGPTDERQSYLAMVMREERACARQRGDAAPEAHVRGVGPLVESCRRENSSETGASWPVQ